MNYNFLKIIITVCYMCAINATFAETHIPKNIQKLLPNGWHSISYANGDLNKDKIADHVVIIEQDIIKPNITTRFTYDFEFPFLNLKTKDDWDSSAAARKMLVFFEDENNHPTLVFEHHNWIDRADYGGMLGDSFEQVEINRGSILINATGGSREMWHHSLRVRHDKQQWQLIGFTFFYVDRINLDSEMVDINLLNFKANKQMFKTEVKTSDQWFDLPFKDKIFLE